MAFRLVRAFFLLLVLALAPVAKAAEVAVILSDRGGVYGEFAAAFQQYSEGSSWHVRWVGSVDSLDTLPRVDLVVAVGAEATRISLQRKPSTPIIATLLPRQAYEHALAELGDNRPKGSVTAIFLDQPISRLLAFTRHLLPEARRIGLLASPETRPVLPQVRRAAAANGLGVEVEEMDSEAGPVTALNLLLPRSDVLLALPDATIYRRDNIRAILLTSYRFQRPVIAFSQALATAGALAAIYSTPAQVARQAAELIRALRQEAPLLPAPQAPSLFAIAINNNVAQALRLTLPDEPSIRRAIAADKDAK